ncbi:hypothetical protein BKA64DRAFT_773000 [Cadophora sp. MPI-SDFR-AT-0126]|nr:hypothetical protein BKA64DRAFT_773000 [Leotiomycetes sp. MPI-SDFR-AT-0126]
MSSVPSTSSANQISTPTPTTEYPIPQDVLEAIEKVHNEGKKVIVMTCGIAGSGKSTLAQNLSTQHAYTRLSIDSLIHQHHGVFGRDYSASLLPSLQDEAESLLKSQLTSLLNAAETDIVLDLSLYSKDDREFYRGVVEREGRGRYGIVLVVFRVRGTVEEVERVLWRRIERRGEGWVRARDEVGEDGERGEGREGMLVERGVLAGYLRGFEWPEGEGEVSVDVV